MSTITRDLWAASVHIREYAVSFSDERARLAGKSGREDHARDMSSRWSRIWDALGVPRDQHPALPAVPPPALAPVKASAKTEAAIARATKAQADGMSRLMDEAFARTHGGGDQTRKRLAAAGDPSSPCCAAAIAVRMNDIDEPEPCCTFCQRFVPLTGEVRALVERLEIEHEQDAKARATGEATRVRTGDILGVGIDVEA